TAPARASSRAIARPAPRVAPATSAIRPSREYGAFLSALCCMLSCSLSEGSVRRLPSWVLPFVASLTDIDDRECHYSATVVDMRSSRLRRILVWAARRPRTRGATLAERYGVGSRTLHRDISVLPEMGVPVWTRTGPAGGVGLVAGWRSPITGMTAPELQALIIGEAGA